MDRPNECVKHGWGGVDPCPRCEEEENGGLCSDEVAAYVKATSCPECQPYICQCCNCEQVLRLKARVADLERAKGRWAIWRKMYLEYRND